MLTDRHREPGWTKDEPGAFEPERPRLIAKIVDHMGGTGSLVERAARAYRALRLEGRDRLKLWQAINHTASISPMSRTARRAGLPDT
jgi:hypothetical protein